MKIGFLHKVNTTPPRSGGSVHTYQVSTYLAGQGHQLLALENELGPQFAKRFPRSISGLFGLIQEADLLYVRIDGRLGWEVSQLFNVHKPVVWEVNASLEEFGAQSEVRWRDRLGAPLRHLGAKHVSTALCVSQPLVEYAQDLGVENTVLVPNGSDPQLFHPNVSTQNCYPGLENQFRVLWAGSTEYSWHDFGIVLRCAKRLLLEDPAISFVILGKRPDWITYALPSNIHFIPPVPYQEVPAYFASAHVGLCLYHPISWSKYGFFFSPLKLFDYAASGVPVLYSNVPELDRIAKNFGLPIDTGDGDDLAEKILRLKRNPVLKEQLAKQGRQAVTSYYNWERVGQQTEGILLALAGNSPIPIPKQEEQQKTRTGII
jgi:glycosyltransferase involved in cell wall biosynthesis